MYFQRTLNVMFREHLMYNSENTLCSGNVTRQMKQTLIEEWKLLHQEMLDSFAMSMDRWCHATVAVTEGYIPY